MAPRVRVVTATNAPKQRRRHRRPQTPFNVKFRPHEITPFMCMPVLPGETLDNLLCQYNVVTDPVVSRMVGWHLEQFYFYCSHRSLEIPDLGYFLPGDLTGMHLSQAADLITGGYGAATNSIPLFRFKGGIDWVWACMCAILARPGWFRDEDQLGVGATGSVVGNYEQAYLDQRNWLQSAKLEAATGDDAELPGVDEVEEQDILTGYTTQYDQWEMMRDQGTEDVTYEDYLRAQGVSVPKAERTTDAGEKIYYPELIRMERKWTYPTNHIDPTDGTPTSAVVWRDMVRANKRRFFKEPGFLFGVMIARPKIYLGNQKGLAAGLLAQADAWRPKVLQGFPYTGVKEVVDSATDGPLQNQDEDYFVDLADLYHYGEPFFNHAIAAADHGMALPGVDLAKRFLTLDQMKSFFVDSGGTANLVHADGLVSLDVLTTLQDTTP